MVETVKKYTAQGEAPAEPYFRQGEASAEPPFASV
jgi:hypothetical protein